MAEALAGSLVYRFEADVAGLKSGLSDVQSHLKLVVNNAEQVGKAASNAGREAADGFKQMADKVADAAYELTTFTGQHVELAKNAIVGLQRAAGSTALALAGLGTAGIVGIAALGAAVINVSKDVAEIGVNARLAGVSLKDMMAFQQVALRLGGTTDGMAKALDGIAKAANEASRGENEFKKILEANGIALEAQNGKLRSTEDLLLDYANIVKNAKTEQDKLAFLDAIGSGRDMVTFFEKGAFTIKTLAEEARNAGSNINEEMVKKATEFDREWAASWQNFKNGAKAAILDIGSMLTSLISKAAGLGSAISAADFNKALMTGGSEDGEKLLDGAKTNFGGLGGSLGPALKGKDALIKALGGGGKKGGSVYPTDDAGSGGGSKAATDGVKNYITSLQEAKNVAEAELKVWNQGNAARKVAVDLVKAEAIAQREGKTLTEDQKRAITEAATATEGYKDKLQQLKSTQQEMANAVRQWADTLERSLEDLILNGKKLGDVLKELLKSLASMAMKSVLTGGGKEGGGLLGSLFSGIFSGFKGLFAEGGSIPAGGWGIAGEKGPELISGPASVTPFGKMGGGGAPNVTQHFHISGAVSSDDVVAMTRQAAAASHADIKRNIGRYVNEAQARRF